MRYFFHVTGGVTPQFDKEGRAFSKEADAMTYAMELANETRSRGQTGVSVIVIDEKGRMHLGLPVN